MTVWILKLGDRPHGVNIVGVYNSRQTAVEELPTHYERIQMVYGRVDSPFNEISPGKWDNNYYMASLIEHVVR